MQLDLTTEARLAQLSYSKNNQTLKQISDIITSANGFDSFLQHIPSSDDTLDAEKGFYCYV